MNKANEISSSLQQQQQELQLHLHLHLHRPDVTHVIHSTLINTKY